MKLTRAGVLASLLSIPALSISAAAHESYHDPALDGQGYCAACHPGFVGGRNSPLHALHTKGSDGMTNNCSLCHTGNGRDNPLLMWSRDDGLGCMGCHGRDYGETIWSDYSDLPTAGKPKASGLGLRRLHQNSGVGYCGGCHPPLPLSIFGEDVSPPYYSRADVSLGDAPLDPCSNEDSLYDSDGLGLDNDGDGLVDAFDPDCQPPAPDIFVHPWLLFWDAVLIGGSEAMVAQLENRGVADLVITQVDLCTGTSAEFTWWPPPPIIVPPFGSQTLTVTYTPIDLGPDQGCLQITSNDPDEPVTLLQLSTTGGAAPFGPDIDLSPPVLDFGVVHVGALDTITTEIRNLGRQDLVVTVIDRCIGTSGEFSWAPPAPLTVPPLSSRTLSVAFAPLDEGVEQGCLEVLSNDPDEPVVELSLSGTGGQAGSEVDLDVSRFRVSNKARLEQGEAVTIELDVENMGGVDEARIATVIGVQNEVQVYQQDLMVSDPPGGGDTSWDFPSYMPLVTGDIVWTVTVADDDPDEDVASAITRVQP